MDDTRKAAAAQKARDRANRATKRVIGEVISVTGTQALISTGGETIPAVIPASVVGVSPGATVRVQGGATPVVESVLGDSLIASNGADQISLAAAFSIVHLRLRKRSGVVQMDMRVTRATDVPAGNFGNINVGTLNNAWWPAVAASCGPTFEANVFSMVSVAGIVVLGGAAVPVSAGNNIDIAGTWLAANP